MEKSNSKGSLVIGMLIGIIIMLVVGIGLFATNTISFSNKRHVNTTKGDNNNSSATSMVDITLPSGNTITTNKEYENVLNGKEKIIVSSDGQFPYKEAKAYNDELYLEDLLKTEKEEYPDGFYACNKTQISNNSFDIDNDGINEILISFCEEYILLHYYNGKVYGYTLPGYRSNGSWRVNGTAYGSGSAFDGGWVKYTFNKEKLESEEILHTERKVYTDPSAKEGELLYRVDGKEVSKEEYETKEKEQLKVKEIEYVDYSN